MMHIERRLKSALLVVSFKGRMNCLRSRWISSNRSSFCTLLSWWAIHLVFSLIAMALISSTLQQAFEQFATTPDYAYEWDDFEPLAPDEFPEFYSSVGDGRPALEEAFVAIGMNGAHCVIAQWDAPSRVVAEWPIVWVDSEGSPTGVFANAFSEFLTILPYGTVFIYNSLFKIQQMERKPELAQYQEDFFTIEAAQQALEEHQQNHPGSQLYLSWLHQIGLEKAANPALLIRQAYQRHTKLEKWLGWTE
jgi:hypothetical protein